MERDWGPGVAAGGLRAFVLGDGDSERLDRFVVASGQGHFRQLAEWGLVLATDPDAKVVHLGVERNGALCAALALAVRRLPRSPWTFLTGLRGPVMDLADGEAMAVLLQGVRRVAREQRAVFLRLDPDYPESDAGVRQILLRHGFVHVSREWSALSDPRIVMRVDLRPTEAELLSKLRKKHRQHINGTERHGLTLRPARDLVEVDRFVDLLTAQCKEKGIPVRDRGYFRALWTHMVRRGFGELFVAEHAGEICAGGLATICGRKSWFLYVAITADARNLFPGEPMYWQVMRWAKERGADLCDFGGTGTTWPPAPESPWYSLYFFKLGFNAEAVFLTGYYDLAFRPLLYRLARLAEDHLVGGRLALLDRLRRRPSGGGSAGASDD